MTVSSYIRTILTSLLLTLPVCAQVAFTLNSGTGNLATLTFNGTSYLAAQPGPFVNTASYVLSGVRTTPSTTPTSSVVVGSVVTRHYAWADIVWTYSVSSHGGTNNALDIGVDITSKLTTQTLDQVWLMLAGIQYPIAPVLGQPQQVQFNVDAPTSVDYKATTTTSLETVVVNTDVVNPLGVGYRQISGVDNTKYYVMTETGTTQFGSSPQRPIAPLGTDHYDISVRFGNGTVSQVVLSQDVLSAFASAFPKTLVTPPNVPISSLFPTSKSRPTNALNPRGWFHNSPAQDITTTSGVINLQNALASFATSTLGALNAIGTKDIFFWSFDGTQTDMTFLGDPTQLETISPELGPTTSYPSGILDPFIATFTNAGINVGFTLRSQQYSQINTGQLNGSPYTSMVNVSGTSVTWVSGATFSTGWVGNPLIANSLWFGGSINNDYQILSVNSTTSMTLKSGAGTATNVPMLYAQMLVLDAAHTYTLLHDKIQYCITRWQDGNPAHGKMRWFYVDTTIDLFGINPASIFQQLNIDFPSVYIMPEEENVQHFAYTIPFNDSRNNTYGPDAVTLGTYPGATTAIYINDSTAVSAQAQIRAAKAAGNRIIYDGWYINHAASNLVQSMYFDSSDGTMVSGVRVKGVKIK